MWFWHYTNSSVSRLQFEPWYFLEHIFTLKLEDFITFYSQDSVTIEEFLIGSSVVKS